MKKKFNNHSKSFAALFSIALFGAVFAVLSAQRLGMEKKSSPAYEVIDYPQPAAEDSAPLSSVDTSAWKTYTNEKYGLSFKYDPAWKIRSISNKDGYYIIEVDPGTRYDNFRIYISQDDYFALSGVPTEQGEVGGKKALSLQGSVLGVKDNATYFTFDMGSSLSLKPYFESLIQTVEFE